jgi:hypothetical protein
MACPFKRAPWLVLLAAALLFSAGCVSYRLTKVEIGQPVEKGAVARLENGRTTLSQALRLLGAPDRIIGLKDRNLLIYRRSISYENSLSVSIPVTDFVVLNSAEVSAEGGLVRFDILALFFTPGGVLEKAVLETGSEEPYFKTLFGEG